MKLDYIFLSYKYVLAIYLIMSVITLLIFGIDKDRARKGKWRIREKTLLLFCFLGGAAGGFVAMILFNHKTRKIIFKILIPIFLFLQIILFLYLYF